MYSILYDKEICTALMKINYNKNVEIPEYLRSGLGQFMSIMRRNVAQDIQKMIEQCEVVN